MPTYQPSESTPITVTSTGHTTTLDWSQFPTTTSEETSTSYAVVLSDPITNTIIVGATITLDILDNQSYTHTYMTSTTGHSGIALFSVSFPNPGSYTLTADFAGGTIGGTTYLASKTPVGTVTVTTLGIATTLTLTAPAGPFYEDTAYNFTAKLTVTSTGTPVASVPIDLYVNNTKVLSRATGDDGIALFGIAFSEPGSYTLVAKFAGYTTPY